MTDIHHMNIPQAVPVVVPKAKPASSSVTLSSSSAAPLEFIDTSPLSTLSIRAISTVIGRARVLRNQIVYKMPSLKDSLPPLPMKLSSSEMKQSLQCLVDFLHTLLPLFHLPALKKEEVSGDTHKAAIHIVDLASSLCSVPRLNSATVDTAMIHVSSLLMTHTERLTKSLALPKENVVVPVEPKTVSKEVVVAIPVEPKTLTVAIPLSKSNIAAISDVILRASSLRNHIVYRAPSLEDSLSTLPLPLPPLNFLADATKYSLQCLVDFLHTLLPLFDIPCPAKENVSYDTHHAVRHIADLVCSLCSVHRLSNTTVDKMMIQVSHMLVSHTERLAKRLALSKEVVAAADVLLLFSQCAVHFESVAILSIQ